MKVRSIYSLYLCLAVPLIFVSKTLAWSSQPSPYASKQFKESSEDQPVSPRRSFLLNTASIAVSSLMYATTTNALFSPTAAIAADLKLETAANSGISWADAQLGTGTPLQIGNTATVDYVLSTTGARYGSKIYASGETPYRWKLGDGSTISGLEYAIMGNIADGIPPVLPGGIRRIIIPQSMAYDLLGKSVANVKEQCVENGTPGPIPPPSTAFEEYQRFKNIYCNPNRQYQPDIVMDIKLYGARSLR